MMSTSATQGGHKYYSTTCIEDRQEEDKRIYVVIMSELHRTARDNWHRARPSERIRMYCFLAFHRRNAFWMTRA